MRAEDPVEKIHTCSRLPNRPQKANGASCSSQQWHPRRRYSDCLCNLYRPVIFLGSGPHKLLHNSSRARHLVQCDFFGICYILPNQHIFANIFFIIGKMCFAAGWNGFASRICPTGRSAENPGIDYEEEWWQHTPLRSTTPTLNGCDLTSGESRIIFLPERCSICQ